jgi:uncharacterized membrane protein YidH (DUF202 family)
VTRTSIGIVLIVLGAIVLAYHGFTYTTREKVIDAGPIQVSADKEHSFAIPPVIGGLAVGAGLVLVIAARRKPE